MRASRRTLDDSDRIAAGRTPHRAAIWLGVLGVSLLSPAGAFYNDASVRSICFNAERAAEMDEPLVLLAHQTRCDLKGAGPRITEEHWIWYVGDPTAPVCREVREPQIPLAIKLEQFEFKQCRVFRGSDTLHVGKDQWTMAPLIDWPESSARWWQGIGTALPELRKGDIVELAYRVNNRWSQHRLPSAWAVIPIRHPSAPTIERHIEIKYNPALKGDAKVIGDENKLVRHFGIAIPRIELLTGNLPAGPPDPTGVGSPRVLFSASQKWSDVKALLRYHFFRSIMPPGTLIESVGDSLAAAHRSSRARLASVLKYAETQWERIPRALTATDYYPLSSQDFRLQRSADSLNYPLLVAALARAARLKAEIMLAHGPDEELIPELPMPMQLDRIILRVLLAEEDRHVLIDPCQSTLEGALEAVSEDFLLFPLKEKLKGFYKRGDDGTLLQIELE